MNARHVLLSSTVLLLACAAAAGAPVERGAPPALGAPRAFELTAPTSFTLQNGLKVIHLERQRAPLIDVIASVEAGATADPQALPGLASWTAAMLQEGAGARDALAFADAQADLGARISTSAGPEEANVALHVSAARFDDALALFADVLVRPRFEAADWARVQTHLLGEMQVKAQDPMSLAALAAARAAWGPTHRFGVDIDGTPAALRSATQEDVRAFHRARYRPDTTALIVVGAISKKALEQKLTAALGGWRADGARPSTPAVAPLQPRKTRGVVGVQVDEAPQTVLRVVNATPDALKPWDAHVEVMNTLLGGSFTSRLNDNLREQHGYAYGAGSRVTYTRAGSVFSVRTAVQAGATVPAVDEILRELARIQQPATQDEVTRARNLVALSFPGELDSNGDTAALWTEAYEHGVDAAQLRDYLARAPRVEVADVTRAAARTVDAERVTVVAVGDLRAHGAELQRFGEMTTWTAEDLLPGIGALTAGAEARP